MSNDVVEVLTKARAFIARGHCKGEAARDANGDMVGSRDPRACSWCVLGALSAATPYDFSGSVVGEDAKDVLRASIGVRSLAEWNDAPETTQAEVVAAFDQAIAAEVARV